jgi:arylsulfatase A-like enzyme
MERALSFPTAILVSLMSSLGVCRAGEVRASSPNMIIIFIDHLGYADLSPFGQTRYETPNLERMAREGRRFTNFYVASSVCTPSRAALLTGCYPVRLDLMRNGLDMDSKNHGVLFPGDRKGLKANLSEGGFRTPAIAWWPETIPAGSATDLMASTLDLLPTFATLIGKPHKPPYPIDGVDISPLFRGPLPAESPRKTFAYYAFHTEPRPSSELTVT